MVQRIDLTGPPGAGTKIPGYSGSRKYNNKPGEMYQLLPNDEADGSPIAYQEWDIYNQSKGVDRGNYRLVTGTDNSVYFTSDHYFSFAKLR